MIKVVADNKIPFLKGALEPYAKVEYLPGKEITHKHVKDADALIIRTRTICNKQLLEGSKVRFIATATIGYDHIDTEYCETAGIQWVNAPGCNAGSVTQYISSALAVIIKDWNCNFNDLTLGIVGAGHVGSRVSQLASFLGIKCLVNDPPRARKENPENFVDLHELLSLSDIVTVHVPLNLSGTDKTYHLADSGFFRQMKPEAWFINTSRGEVHSTHYLIKALESGKLGGAVIDVWENEPEIHPHLLELIQIGTPHIAGYSLDGKANGTKSCVRALSKFFNLQAINWQPENLTQPAFAEINLDCQNKTPENIYQQLALHSYNIMADSQKLKESPSDFELQRENYPIRRESNAYKVLPVNCTDNMLKMIQNLGYKISTSPLKHKI